MAIKYSFPQNFWWGAATSGPQSEGRFHKAHRNVFDYWFDEEPQAFFGGVGPNVASNFYNDYQRDIALMKAIGLNSVRTSIQWTRLIRDFEAGAPDPDGVRFYNAVIDEFLRQGSAPSSICTTSTCPSRSTRSTAAGKRGTWWISTRSLPSAVLSSSATGSRTGALSTSRWSSSRASISTVSILASDGGG